ncbi:hypothetical protein [Agromyces bauzanensis]
MITTTTEMVATSRADDLAFRALANVAAAAAAFETRIVGGQMVSLLTTAYPTPDAITRQTADADADAAITLELAASGGIHDLFTAAGFAAVSARWSRWSSPERVASVWWLCRIRRSDGSLLRRGARRILSPRRMRGGGVR